MPDDDSPGRRRSRRRRVPPLTRDPQYEALARRFVLVERTAPLPGLPVNLLAPRSAEELISEADFEVDERLPYWADLWPSALMLAKRLASSQGSGPVLELGCGLGLVTIAAMHAGFEVLATDYYEDALRFTRVNARRVLGREPATRLVDWRALPDDLGTFPRIIASDVLYEQPYAELVAGVLARALTPGGEATIADPGRRAAPAFLTAAAGQGLVLQRKEAVPFEDGPIRQRITLYTLTRPA